MNKKLSVSLMALVAIAGFAMAAPVFANTNGSVSASADLRLDNEWQETRNEVREEWNDTRTDLREDIKEQRSGFLNMFRIKRDDIKADIKARWRDIIEARWQFVGNGFVNIMARLDSRISKLEAEGKNVDTAKKHLAAARASFAEAREEASDLAQDAKENDLTQEEKIEARAEIEANLKAAKESLRLSAQALIDIK